MLRRRGTAVLAVLNKFYLSPRSIQKEATTTGRLTTLIKNNKSMNLYASACTAVITTALAGSIVLRSARKVSIISL